MNWPKHWFMRFKPYCIQANDFGDSLIYIVPSATQKDKLDVVIRGYKGAVRFWDSLDNLINLAINEKKSQDAQAIKADAKVLVDDIEFKLGRLFERVESLEADNRKRRSRAKTK